MQRTDRVRHGDGVVSTRTRARARRAATPVRLRLHGKPRNHIAEARRSSRPHRAADRRRHAHVVDHVHQRRARSCRRRTSARRYRPIGVCGDVCAASESRARSASQAKRSSAIAPRPHTVGTTFCSAASTRLRCIDTDQPKVLLPGAFNPLHDGHLAMAQFAARHYGAPVAFEICANNVDKPRLNYLALRNRVAQFDASTPVWVTNTATFIEKARRFPGVKFVVGVDTASRIGDAKYYGNDPARLAAAVGELAALGCGFLVFGRTVGGKFTGLDDITLPAALRAICTAVPAAEFRNDVSSTALRKAGRGLDRA